MVYKGADLFLLCVSADRNDYRGIEIEENSTVSSNDLVEKSIK